MADASIVDLLRRCEEQSPYGASQIQIAGRGAEVFVVSDLHIGPGKTQDGCYTATENFFADESFRRFLRHALDSLGARPGILVINGDMVDFLRTTGYPKSASEFAAWRELLVQLGIAKTEEELRASISKKERNFGLQTDDYKSVWKFDQVVRGHPQFFAALADWIARGHRLIVVKGNHDLELYWPGVRNFLRLALAQALPAGDRKLERTLAEWVLPGLMFVDDSCVVDDVLYIEHGHRYDRYAQVVGGALLPGGTQLNLPFGSFFNRYVLNRVELAFPYADNVRPSKNLLPLLIRERFFVAMKLLAYQIPLALRTIPKGYYRYIFGRAATVAFVVLVPLLVSIAVLLSAYPPVGGASHWLSRLSSLPGSKLALSFFSLAGSYFLSRIVAYFQLAEPDSLASNARTILAEHADYRFVTMGHTHNPDQFRDQQRYYFNTGTWIPIVELDTAQVREDNTYTFLHFRRGSEDALEYSWLERWNDDAGRVEDLLIRSPK